MTKGIKDKELGMGREITRRDFLNGVAIGVGGTLVAGEIGSETLLEAGVLDEFAPEKSPDYYPPAKMGMRGNHDGTFTFSHRLRDMPRRGRAQYRFRLPLRRRFCRAVPFRPCNSRGCSDACSQSIVLKTLVRRPRMDFARKRGHTFRQATSSV